MMDRRAFLALGTTLVGAPGAARAADVAEPALEVLARVGPWPVASRLIGYRGRLWFANSVKGRNHNSADIWSLDPITGNVRYERHLFSQDAGHPLVHGGLLYWPFEDGRFSLGWGMAEVTDGQSWRPLVIPTAEIFHTHSMIGWRSRLLAVTSAWRAGLQVSDDGGRGWQELYEHPTPKRRLSRIHEPVLLGDALFVYLKDRDGIRLARFVDDRFEAVPGWPRDVYFFSATVHKGSIFAVVIQKNRGREIWRTDGRRSILVSEQLAGRRLMDLTSDGSRLWAVSQDGEGGQLWSSPDGVRWGGRMRMSGGKPTSLRIVAGGIYVAGAGDDGQGIVWGPPLHRVPDNDAPASLPIQFTRRQDDVDWRQFGVSLDALLADTASYENHGRGKLRAMVFDAVKSGAPPGFFAARLKSRFPIGTVPAFGGKMTVDAAEIGQSILLWGMGLARQGEVPTAIFRRPWSKPANSFEKYFAPQLAAIWAVVAAEQKDRATIDALMQRLEDGLDPPWLRAQVVGALTALTGERFAHDGEKWRRWWAAARPTWKE